MAKLNREKHRQRLQELESTVQELKDRVKLSKEEEKSLQSQLEEALAQVASLRGEVEGALGLSVAPAMNTFVALTFDVNPHT